MKERPEQIEYLLCQWLESADSQALSRYDADAAYSRFMKRTRQSLALHQSRRQTAGLSWLHSRLARAAAVVVLLGLSAFLAYMGGKREVSSSFADMVVEAPQGSRTRVVLPDGTTVWLNAASRLSYSQGFNVTDRRAQLQGEGYFEVAHRADLPFVVSTGSLEVTVRGTKFNLRDYPSDPDAACSLLEGSVVASNLIKGGQHLLVPGQRVVVDKRSGLLAIEGCDADDARQWTRGVLIMNGETLPEVARRLERSYNVSITIATDSLHHLRFYGDFARQEQSLHEVLDALVLTGKLHYRQTGNQVELY